MSRDTSLKKILILVTILVVPGFLYYLLQDKGKNRYRPLNIYGPKQVASTYHTKRGKQIPDTIYHVIRDVKLTDQRGDAVTFPPDSNQISVVSFFYTRCTGSCIAMNKAMQRVAEQYAGNRMLRFCSVTVDPEHDTPEVLAGYAANYQAKPGKWHFLTGNKDQIRRMAREDFLVDVMEDQEHPGNIIHSPMLILIDPQGRIRGFYDSAAKEQVEKLTDEIKVLIAEELRMVTDR